MKKITVSLFACWLMTPTGLSIAQNLTPAVTPSINAPSEAPKHKSHGHERFHLQLERIQQGEKSGVLSKDHAALLKNKLRSINKKGYDYFIQNGKKPLTPDQKSEIKKLLDENSKAIYQAKHPGQTATTDSAVEDSDPSN